MAGTFDLSARITGDASGLVKAATEGERAIDGVGTASKRAATGSRELEQATEGLAGATGKAELTGKRLVAAQTEMMRATQIATTATIGQAVAQDRAERSALATAAAEARLATANNNAERSAAAAALAALKLDQAQDRVGRSARTAGADLDRHAYGARNLGQQFGDLGLSIAGGISPARAFGQQIGQIGYAASEMGGKIGAVGKFLTGPWGIALTVASAVLAPFVEKLFESATAAKQAEVGAYALGDAQSALGGIFDLTSGKLKEQNELLILNARLTAINLRATALAKGQAARDALNDASTVSTTRRVGGAVVSALGGALGGDDGILGRTVGAIGASTSRGNVRVQELARATQRANAIKDDAARTKALDGLLQRSDKVDFGGSGVDKTQFQQAIIDAATSRANTAIADQIDASLNSGKLASGLKRDARTKKPAKPEKPPSTAARDEFGEDTANRLANIRAGLDDTPSAVRAVNKQLGDLNDLIDDIRRKKPLNMEKLIADAQALEPLIRNSITKPFDDFIRDQQEALNVQRLTAAGQIDQANALRVIQGLQRTMGPLTAEQKNEVGATTIALRLQGEQIEANRQANAKYLEALGGIKGVVEDATQAFVRGDLGQLLKSPGKLLDAFQTLQGRKLFDSIFGDIFKDLEDQVNGTSTVRDASDRMAKSVDKVSVATDDLRNDFSSLGQAVRAASGALSSGHTLGGSPITGDLFELLKRGNGVTGAPTQRELDEARDGADILVTGRSSGSKSTKKAETIDVFGASIDKIFGKLGIKDPGLFGRSIGQNAGKALGGASQGAAIATALKPIANALGLKTSKTGSQIGGAIGGLGSAIPGIGPFLPAIGGVIGSVVGGLFKGSKVSSAGITVGANGQFAAGTATGNSASGREAAGGLAGNIASSLNAIASQLGGSVGATPNITVGTKNGKIHVNAVGGKIGKKGSGDIGFGQDEAAAQSYAITQAIAQGAVTGLSAAIQAALKSSTDVDAALKEALDVKALETSIGGLGSALKNQFDAFDKQAANRVRLARQYGLDLVAVEKLNGEERTKLVDDALKSRIGSLSDFLQSVKFGDLFEGSASERRQALLAEIAKVQTDAEAGVEGAADKLAALSQQLISTSREAFGTAGPELATDRASTISGVERVIQMETERVNTAAGLTKATTDAVVAGNALANEGNDLTAITNARLGSIEAILNKIAGDGGLLLTDTSLTLRQTILG